jgi:hypothetical protein
MVRASSAPNWMIASSRLRNSGENIRLIASMPSLALSCA